MSQLDELIKRYCPEGVPWKKLCDVAEISAGAFVKKDKQNPNGLYPVYNGGISNTGYYDEYNMTENKIIISARGANAGCVNRVLQKFWAGNSCYSIDIKDKDLLFDFVYHILKNGEKELRSLQQKSSIPSISKKKVENYVIPVPPLNVQKEMIMILDELDTHYRELISKLYEEISLRETEYEYYRDVVIGKLTINN